MKCGGDPATAAIIGIGAAGLMANVTMSSAANDRTSGPPQISDTNKKVLSSYASRLVEEEEKIKQQARQGNYLLGPNSQPIRFGPQTKMSIPSTEGRFTLT